MKECECGNIAVREKNGYWVCARCDDLETKPYDYWHKKVGFKEDELEGSSGASRINHEDYYIDKKPICGESLLYLEQMLRMKGINVC